MPLPLGPRAMPRRLSRIRGEHRYRHRVSLGASAFTQGNDLPWNPAKHSSVEKVLYTPILSYGGKTGKNRVAKYDSRWSHLVSFRETDCDTPRDEVV